MVEGITLASDDEIKQKAKDAPKKIVVDTKDDNEYQVGKKDEKEIEFFNGFLRAYSQNQLDHRCVL